MSKKQIQERDGWLWDEHGNRNEIAYHGSREAAEKALLSLKNCDNCVNCSDCSDCSYCSRCSDCSYCSRCSYLRGKHGDDKTAAVNGPPPVPVIPNIHSTIYAAASRPEALKMNIWHTCENTHCRAGWAVTLAGAKGKALEAFYNTELAAMMIYDASSPGFKISPARFYDKNDDALADMKRLAEAERQKDTP